MGYIRFTFPQILTIDPNFRVGHPSSKTCFFFFWGGGKDFFVDDTMAGCSPMVPKEFPCLNRSHRRVTQVSVQVHGVLAETQSFVARKMVEVDPGTGGPGT